MEKGEYLYAFSHGKEKELERRMQILFEFD